MNKPRKTLTESLKFNPSTSPKKQAMPTSNIPTATSNNQIIPVPADEFRGFIANVLRMNDWSDIITPHNLKTVTALQKDQKRGHSTWEYLFKLKISYKKHESGTLLNYELSETKQKSISKAEDKLFDLVKLVAEMAMELVEAKADEATPITHGSAKFADEKELREKGYILSNTPSNRLILAPWGKDEFIVVPEKFTNMHTMVCGPTGVGKSSGFFIPNLVYRTETSVIVTEATAGDEEPDLYMKTAGWRQFKGSKVYFFNPDYPKGTRINPLDKLKYASPGEFAQVADELANLVIVNTTLPGVTRSDPIWDKSEKHLLWIMIMHVAKSQDPSMANFGAIREILRKSDKQIRQILADSESPIAQEEFDSFLSHSSENFRHGVFAGLLQRLNPWLSSTVQTMTSTTDLDLSTLAQENFSFYLSVPSRKAHVKPIAALIFNFLLDLVLSQKFKYPPALMLDEFTNFGAIPNINDALSIIRKRDIPVVLGFQTHSQLSTTYTRTLAEQITSQLATRVFFRPRESKDAQELSDALDDQTIIEKKTDDNGRTSVRELGKPLMSVRDIANLPPSEVIIQTESTNPIKTTRFDYNTCPAPTGFDLPPLPVHELVRFDDLKQNKVEQEENSAKTEAQKERQFSNLKKEVQDTIDETNIRFKFKPSQTPASPSSSLPNKPAQTSTSSLSPSKPAQTSTSPSSSSSSKSAQSSTPPLSSAQPSTSSTKSAQSSTPLNKSTAPTPPVKPAENSTPQTSKTTSAPTQKPGTPKPSTPNKNVTPDSSIQTPDSSRSNPSTTDLSPQPPRNQKPDSTPAPKPKPKKRPSPKDDDWDIPG